MEGGGGVWHKASVSDCLPLAAPIGLSPLLTGRGGGGVSGWGSRGFKKTDIVILFLVCLCTGTGRHPVPKLGALSTATPVGLREGCHVLLELCSELRERLGARS